MAFAGAALVAAESILALTPVAIKKTPLDPLSALWSRILSSAFLGYALTGDRGLARAEYGPAAALGFTNLVHIASSYESFRHLPAGQAMSLLYTYPMWNLVLGSLAGLETVQPKQWLYMGVALLGSLLLNVDPGHAAPTPLDIRANPVWGVIMGLLMAISESGMHTLLKGLGWRDPAKSVWVVSASAATWLTAALTVAEIANGSGMSAIGARSGSARDAFILTAFHSLSMFSGYWLRFYAVPRLSIVTYSILSYAGLIASYLFGLAFLGERPGWMSLLGALMILGAGLLLQTVPAANAAKPESEPGRG